MFENIGFQWIHILPCVSLVLFAGVCYGLDNGLALTPPMGWLSWERFRCNTDCVKDPNNCISESLIKQMADRLAEDGYKDVGYEYVIIDDCWLAPERGPDGRLQPDPQRFPSGIQQLADYVHSKGLKFGIYEDFGVKTCGGYPGSEFYMQLDAQTFADWDVDYLKFDGCNSDVDDMSYGYPAMSFYLNMTGRPIVFSCEWPLYVQLRGKQPDYVAIQKACNLWRNHGDIEDSWSSVHGILDYYGRDVNNLTEYAKPGAWNDPDMLVIGNFGLAETQSMAQMAMWAIMASPLLMSSDLRDMPDFAKMILLNQRVIAINQDPMGIQGRRILVVDENVEVWSRPTKPAGSFALGFLQPNNNGAVSVINVLGSDIGLVNVKGYNITEVFSGRYIGVFKPSSKINVTVSPTGVVLITAIPHL